MLNKDFKCVIPFYTDVANQFAEALWNSAGEKILVGPGDKTKWSVGGDADNPVDFHDRANAQWIPAIVRDPESLCITPAQRYPIFPKRDDWHFSKSDATDKAFGTLVAHLIKASHACWKIHVATSLCRTDAEDVRKTSVGGGRFRQGSVRGDLGN